MKNKDAEYRTIDIVDLLLDVSNPRFEEQNSQREALSIMAAELGPKLVKLAEHIAQHGPNPSEMPIVMKSVESNQYVVLEGNRRIAAIKLCTEPKLVDSLNLPSGIAKALKKVNENYGTTLPLSLQCWVAPNRKLAKIWIELRHTGENYGIGIISWNGVATSRFRGETPEIQLLEHVKESEFLDDETREKLSKISITNLQRLLDTPEAIKILGVAKQRGQLVFLNPENKNDTIGKLAIVVSDISNKHIKVTQLDSKDQRVGYATAVAARELPSPGKKIPPTDLSGQEPAGNDGSKKRKKRQQQVTRKTLVPKGLILNINQVRINKIFGEMKRLPITRNFENSAAVLLRVFLEMSLIEFAKQHRIKLEVVKKGNARDMTIRQKICCIADFMEKQSICDKNELHGIRTLANDRTQVFSMETWHAYIHNPDYNPSPENLMRDWDNIQPFFEKLWA